MLKPQVPAACEQNKNVYVHPNPGDFTVVLLLVETPVQFTSTYFGPHKPIRRYGEGFAVGRNGKRDTINTGILKQALLV